MMVRALRGMVNFGAVVLTILFFGSFFGGYHPIGDSLAVFRLPIAAVFALWVIWSHWPYWIRWGIAVLCLAAMGQIVALKYVSHPTGPVRVYQKNLKFLNDQVDPMVQDIRATNADIVTLQELTSRNAGVVRSLRAEFPHQASCALTTWARVAVLSKWPVVGQICVENQGLIGVQIDAPDGVFWAFSLHAFWPWPYEQPDQLRQILPVFDDIDDPIILSGDFNMVPWAAAVRHLATATGTTRAGPLFPTLIKRGVPLPIDLVYAPGGGHATKRDLLGSDHSGVVADVFVFD